MGQSISNMIVESSIFFPSPPPSYTENAPGLVLVESVQYKCQVPIFVSFPRRRGFVARNCALYFHANACDIGHVKERVDAMADSLGWIIVTFEFPGYGIRTKDPVTLEGISLHSVVALSYILRVLKFSYSDIFFWGRSIGCGPAAYLAKSLALRKKLIGGLILQSPYTSISELAGDYIPISRLLIKKAWDVQSVLAESGGYPFPMCIVHGGKDAVIGIEHGYELFKRTLLPRWLKIGYFPKDADHHEIDTDKFIKYLKELERRSVILRKIYETRPKEFSQSVTKIKSLSFMKKAKQQGSSICVCSSRE